MPNLNPKNWLTRQMIIPILAVAMGASVGIYQISAPAAARAASPAPAAAALDDNSVNALLALDQAMETLAARVTPAVVNVTVTSKTKPDEQAQVEIPDDMRR